MDPDRLMIAARRAFRAENPDVSEVEACAHVGDVYDAVNALMDRYGSIEPRTMPTSPPALHLSGACTAVSACCRVTGFLIGQTDCLRQVR
jgi:hypothetical protein